MARERQLNASKGPHSARTTTKSNTVIWKLILYIVIPLNLVLLYRFIFSDVVPVEFEYPGSVNFSGPLKPNSILSTGKKLFSNSFVGPESLVFDTLGNIYVGVLDGRILKIYPSSTGEQGEGLVEDFYTIRGVSSVGGVNNKGRPLGLRIKDDQLYVADAFNGVYSIDLKKKSLRILVQPNDVTPPMKFTNDLTLSSDGSTIYFTDSSYRWNIDLLTFDVLEGMCKGRVFKFDITNSRIELFASGLCFTNGIEISEDGNTLLVSETTRHRVNYFDIESKKIIRQTLLPGMPDNIRRYNGKYWVGVSVMPSKLLARFSQFPTLRRLITAVTPHIVLKKLANTHYGLAVELSEDGVITRSLHDPSGETCFAVSQTTVTESGDIFICSYMSPYFVKVKF